MSHSRRSALGKSAAICGPKSTSGWSRMVTTVLSATGAGARRLDEDTAVLQARHGDRFRRLSMHSGLLQQLGDEAGPSGLVTGAHAAAAVAVEVLMERDVI